jgi:tetratricopeptide (TPR) repeat protein
MGELYASMTGKEDSAAAYYARASMMEKEDAKKMIYFKKISNLYKKIKDYKNEATWLGMYYAAKINASNVDLFNWGLADYLAKDYPMADSLFTLYEQKYPTEEFGYYWAARSSAAIDTSMEKGLAILHYKGLIDLYAKDTTSKISKKHLVEAYGYIAAYKANTEKDYEGAIDNFDKLLQMDPENNDAKRYVEILKKTLAKSKNSISQAAK